MKYSRCLNTIWFDYIPESQNCKMKTHNCLLKSLNFEIKLQLPFFYYYYSVA